MKKIPPKNLTVWNLWVLVYNGGDSLSRVQFCSVNGILQKQPIDLVYQKAPKQMFLNETT